jgi:hypothetical protein
MFDDTLIRQLAAELHQSEQSRVQVEHFSKRYPGMTIEDGYRVSRAWVDHQARRRPHRHRPQDRPDLARHAAGQPDRPSPTTARLLDRHALHLHAGPGALHSYRHALLRAAGRGRTGLHAEKGT